MCVRNLTVERAKQNTRIMTVCLQHIRSNGLTFVEYHMITVYISLQRSQQTTNQPGRQVVRKQTDKQSVLHQVARYSAAYCMNTYSAVIWCDESIVLTQNFHNGQSCSN